MCGSRFGGGGGGESARHLESFFFFFSVFKSSGRVVHTVGRVYTSALRSSCVGIIVSRVIYDFVAYCRHAA